MFRIIWASLQQIDHEMKGFGGDQTQALQTLSEGTVPPEGNGVSAWKEVHLSLHVLHLWGICLEG